MSKELKILKDNLKGPIQRIIDPSEYTTDEIMASYFREILFLARKYTRPTVEYEDLVVEGLMGLLDAIRRFDPVKAGGNPKAFHNLAVVRIKSNMFEYFLSNNNVYTIPNYMARALTLVDQIRNALHAREYNGDPDVDLRNYEAPNFEAEAPKEAASRVRNLKEKIKTLAHNSDRTYEEMIANVLKVEQDIEGYENAEVDDITPEMEAAQKDFLGKFLENLNPDARNVISLLLEGKTLEEVGAEMGFTRERARQIKEETLGFFQKTRMYKDAIEE
jgi:RNA polymerase sigma factor for flagellar operon FliA